MAPESFYDGTWDHLTDVWMFAVLLWGVLRNHCGRCRHGRCTEIFSFSEKPWSQFADDEVMGAVSRQCATPQCMHAAHPCSEKLSQPKLCPDDLFDVLLGVFHPSCVTTHVNAALPRLHAHRPRLAP